MLKGKITESDLNIVYDAEVLAVIYTIFSELKLPSFKIYINNRKLLSGYLEHLEIADNTKARIASSSFI